MDPSHPNQASNSGYNWAWWSSDLPYFPSSQALQSEGQHQLTSIPSPAAFNTPLSDSYLLHHAASSPYLYHGSPHAWRGPQPRSMSVSAIPTTESSSLQSASGSILPPPRQIRFVSSDGQPHTKRRRINAACLTCRKRKTRCSGERPECKTCTDNGHVCAGYAEKAHRKDDDKNDDEGDDEDDSGPPPSHRYKHEKVPSSSTVEPPSTMPKLEKQSSGESTGSNRSGLQDDLENMKSPASNHTANSVATSTLLRNRVPYFRYFGPTAIVPGFKQMVVQLKDHRRSLPSVSGSPASAPPFDNASISGQERIPVEIPFYDATDPAPNATLITHLCEIFFTHLGCNYPFLQRDRFMRDLEEKRVDAILVDAVCAVAARFSKDPMLATPSDSSVPIDIQSKTVKRAFRGNPFAQRAMSAVVDTFACPTLAVAQACLLLAYEEFGTDHDSGLWMYLGTAIRMAQDLGIQKLEGMQLEGRIGPTPKTAKHGSEGKVEEAKRAGQQKAMLKNKSPDDPQKIEDRRSSEQERIDSFWAIFFLDRAVSSGVGRPVTLRDKDIEISFPYRPDEKMVNGYPHPFPALIRIVHMYGRVADVLNNIKDVSQVTPDVLRKLASMEKDLTGIYQRLSLKLHFNATNFQHYVKAEQGTNFILLHFWFHTLIVLVHQPTLLHSFEGRIQQLFPDSRELSMSSAKTIADILAFAELIDVKSFIGNPFTSQPMYVAACAFLAEAAAHASQPPSRSGSPTEQHAEHKRNAAQQRAVSAKHTLLASAANQNYQRCYKALALLNSYWSGCRYILTALDQKANGLMDPLLFTSDDVDGDMPSTEPSFTTPGWRRSTSNSASMGGPGFGRLKNMYSPQDYAAWSPKMDWIGWSLTGTTNSPAPNISFIYPNTSTDTNEAKTQVTASQKLQQTTVHRPSVRSPTSAPGLELQNRRHINQDSVQDHPTIPPYKDASALMPPPSAGNITPLPYDTVSTAEADLLLGLHSPYAGSTTAHNSMTPAENNVAVSMPQSYDYVQATSHPHPQDLSDRNVYQSYQQPQHYDFSDMLIQSQDVDMNDPNSNFTFPGGDMIPWLEYLPQDVLSYFGDPGDEASTMMPSGPGPPSGENG